MNERRSSGVEWHPSRSVPGVSVDAWVEALVSTTIFGLAQFGFVVPTVYVRATDGKEALATFRDRADLQEIGALLRENASEVEAVLVAGTPEMRVDLPPPSTSRKTVIALQAETRDFVKSRSLVVEKTNGRSRVTQDTGWRAGELTLAYCRTRIPRFGLCPGEGQPVFRFLPRKAKLEDRPLTGRDATTKSEG